MILRLGSKGDNVKKLQKKLGIDDDGDFGPQTDKSVKTWQTKNGFKSDGIVSKEMWDKLFPSEIIKEDVVLSKTFDLTKLKGHVPDSVISQIPETSKRFNITNTLRLCHFLSQCAHESGGFKVVQENLNYSSSRLREIFPKYFPGNLSESYSGNPEKIASKVYGGRMGNGVEATKDGWKFRGRGFLQMTGKENYSRFAKFIGEDTVSNPDLVATKYPLASAAFFFDSNKLWSICDKGSTPAVVTEVTRRVNGGTIGLNDRLKEFNKFFNLLK